VGVQGYSFKVVTNLVPPEEAAGLQLSNRSDRLDLLATLKSQAEAAEAIEADANDDGLPAKPQFFRKKGTLAAVSGGQGLLYKEFSTRTKGPSVRKLVMQRRAA
jgi:hypothetical protein